MFAVRREKGKFNGYQAFFNNQEPSLDWPSYGLGKHHVGKTWQGFPGTMRRVTDIYPVEFAVSAFGNQISIYVNGEHIASHTDDDSAEGEVAVSLTETGHAVLRDLEVCVLDGTKLTPDDVFPQQLLAKKNSVLKTEFLTAERKKGNLLRNGSFEEQDPSAWIMESWRSLKESCTVIADNGRDGSRILKIQNNLSDDVSYKQTVKVKPITRYLLSGWIKTRSVQDQGNSLVRGAHLYLWGGYERMTPTMTGTHDWTYFAVAFRSGNRTSVDLAARLGYFAGDVTGTAWFDDLCLIELPESDVVSELERDGFVPLFNGKNLAGWVNVNTDPGTFFVKDGEIVTTGTPYGFLRTGKRYENFELELDWMHVDKEKRANSGLFIWCDPQAAEGKPFPRGFEVQVLANLELRDMKTNAVTATSHGDIFSSYGASCKPDRPHPLGWERCLPSENRAEGGGEWNHYKVIAKDGVIKLHVNGKEVSGVSDCTPSKGYIALQSEGAECHFKNIRIKELPPSVEQGFVPLFNGKDLAGWKTHPDQPGGWTIEGGSLVGRGQLAHHLFTERGDFEDFHLRAELKINQQGSSGIYFRSNFNVDRGRRYPTAYEVQFDQNRPQNSSGTGSLRLHGGVKPDPAYEKSNQLPNTWFTLEVIAQGNRLIVKVNGKVTADVTDTDNRYRKGHLVLQSLLDGADRVVHFRKIEVKEFKP